MIKVLRIDEAGFYIEDVILQEGDLIPADCIEIQPPDGMIRLKWDRDAEAWIEGATLEELQDHQEDLIGTLKELQDKIDQELRRERQIDAILQATQKLIRVDELTAGEMQAMIDLYPDWIPVGMDYTKDTVVQYGDKLYKVLKDHPSQADWKPGTAFALYMVVPPKQVIANFVQPFGGSGTYVKGVKVIFEGKVYENIFTDGLNVWSPVGYPAGWKLIP